MKSALVLTFLIGLSSNAFAAPERCQIKSVFDMVAFGSESITGKNLKSNGSISSGLGIQLLNANIESTDCITITSKGNITLNDSTIVGSVESLSKLKISKGSVKGSVRSPQQIDLTDTSVGIVLSPKGSTLVNSTRERWLTLSPVSAIDTNILKNDLLGASKKYALKLKTQNLKAIVYKDNLTLSLKNPETVFDIASTDLEKIKSLEIRGDKEQKLIINISGDSITLDKNMVDISGDIEPSNVIWNFHQAKTIIIKDTIDQVVGIPGQIIAPLAKVILENALVSGGVYARVIELNLKNNYGTSELRDTRRLND